MSNKSSRLIFCCGCQGEVAARLTDGAEIYPHRHDLKKLPFWKCDGCGNHVGCHHKTKDRTRPLGTIPTPELRQARRAVHDILDRLWQGKTNAKSKRSRVYLMISENIGKEFHTSEINSLDEARRIWVFINELHKSLKQLGGARFFQT